MDSTAAARARAVLEAKGVARSRDLEEAGISRAQIRRLVQQGIIVRVARGLYRDPDAPLTERADLAEAACQAGSCVC